MKNEDYIDDLFKKGIPDELHTDDAVSDWNAMQSKINKYQFWHFHPTFFNVYYAIAIGMVTSGLLYFLAKPSTSKSDENSPSKTESHILNSDSTETNTTNESAPINKKKNITLELKTSGSSNQQDSVVSNSLSYSDTSSIAPHTAIPIPDSTPVKKPKKKITSRLAQDTVRQNDTIWIDKKRKKK